MERRTMTVQELSTQMGVSKPTAYALVKQHRFPALRVGRRIVIPVAAFEDWLMESAANRTEHCRERWGK